MASGHLVARSLERRIEQICEVKLTAFESIGIYVRDIIRREIGFDGLLMSDDLSMSALEGPFATRTRQSLEAGCDVVLHCNGRMDEMIEIASAVPILAGRARERAEAALSKLRPPGPFDVAAANAALGKMMGAVP